MSSHPENLVFAFHMVSDHTFQPTQQGYQCLNCKKVMLWNDMKTAMESEKKFGAYMAQIGRECVSE